MIPENEMGVIVLFSQQSERAGYEIVSIGAKFPDAIVRKNGAEYKAEFEFDAGNFVSHGHDARECDIIICWSRGSYDGYLHVVAISETGWESVPVSVADHKDLTIEYWRNRARKAEWSLKAQIKSNTVPVVVKVYTCPECGREFDTRQGLGGHNPTRCKDELVANGAVK